MNYRGIPLIFNYLGSGDDSNSFSGVLPSLIANISELDFKGFEISGLLNKNGVFLSAGPIINKQYRAGWDLMVKNNIHYLSETGKFSGIQIAPININLRGSSKSISFGVFNKEGQRNIKYSEDSHYDIKESTDIMNKDSYENIPDNLEGTVKSLKIGAINSVSLKKSQLISLICNYSKEAEDSSQISTFINYIKNSNGNWIFQAGPINIIKKSKNNVFQFGGVNYVNQINENKFALQIGGVNIIKYKDNIQLNPLINVRKGIIKKIHQKEKYENYSNENALEVLLKEREEK